MDVELENRKKAIVEMKQRISVLQEEIKNRQHIIELYEREISNIEKYWMDQQ